MKKNLNGSKFMLFLIIWVFVLMMALQFLFIVLRESGVNVNAVMVSPWFLIAQQLVIFILPLFIWLALKGDNIKQNLPNQKLGGKNIMLIIALSFLIQPVMMTISAVMSLFVTNDVAGLMDSFMAAPFWLTILAIAVTPAICEELVFRGYIQSQYNDRTIKKTALINGLFFAIIHLNFHQFAYAFVMGVVFAYMVHYTRSIWAGIIPHFIVNASQAVLFRLANMAQPAGYSPDVQAAEELLAAMPISMEAMAIIIISVIALCLSPVIFILFREFFRHNKWRVAAGPEDGGEVSEGLQVDYYTVLVVAVFIGFMVLMMAF